MPADIKKPLKKFLPNLVKARDENLNEADTVQRIMKLLEDVLGYDALEDLSREANMKGKFVDVLVKVDGRPRLIVEAKSASTKLRDRHIEQAQSYASRNNYPWVVLTNGLDWILYHLTFDEGIDYVRAFTINLEDKEKFDDAAADLALLSRQSIKKGELEDFWKKVSALSPGAVGKALFDEQVLNVLRRELRRETGLLVDIEDLADAIKSMLEPDARAAIGPVRIRKHKPKSRKKAAAAAASSAAPEPAETSAAATPSDPPSTQEGESS